MKSQLFVLLFLSTSFNIKVNAGGGTGDISQTGGTSGHCNPDVAVSEFSQN